MSTTQEHSRRLALLAGLALSDEVLSQRNASLDSTLSYVDQLSQVSTASLVRSELQPHALRSDTVDVFPDMSSLLQCTRHSVMSDQIVLKAIL